MLETLRRHLRDEATAVERLVYAIMAITLTVWGVGEVCFALGLMSRSLETALGAYPGGYLLARQPWGLLTYPWVHRDLAHLMINMVVLYYVGHLYERRYGGGSLVALFLMGTLAGAFLYSFGYQVLWAMRVYISPLALIGSSAGIYALAWGVAFARPEASVGRAFGLRVRLTWLVALLLAVDVLLSMRNLGGQLAHVGGALLGLWWGYQMRRHGRDITEWVRQTATRWRAKLMCKASTSRSEVRVPLAETPASDAEYLAVLRKLRESGYASLTSAERKRLHDTSTASDHDAEDDHPLD